MPKVIAYKKGAILYFEGDKDEKIFILKRGNVVLSTTDLESGKSVANQVKAGEFFGVKSALGRFPREETASVMSDSVIICLTVQEFETNFSGNKQIILKMLRVFSNQLRQIHKKIESILQSVPENQKTGMLSVARSFFKDEQYVSCYDVCMKFLKSFPGASCLDEIKEMFRISNAYIKKNPSVYDESAIEGDGALKLFELPTFERFAKKYAPGQVIISEFEPGDTFYLIQRGEVQLLKCVNGSSKNLDILRAGEFFGEMAILDNSPRSATCMAKTSVKCLEFSKVNFESIITGNPQLALNLLKLFCKRIFDQHRRLQVLVIKDNQIRIADVLVMLCDMNPNYSKASRSVKIDAGINDIAHWAGLSYDTTRDELSKMSEKGKVALFDTYMIVENVSDMKRIVDMYKSQSEKSANIMMRYKTQKPS